MKAMLSLFTPSSLLLSQTRIATSTGVHDLLRYSSSLRGTTGIMHSTRGYASDLHASGGHANEKETRHSGHREGHHVRHEEDNEHHESDARYQCTSRIQHSEDYNNRDRTYYHQTQDRPYERSRRHDDEHLHIEDRYDRDSKHFDSYYLRDSLKGTKAYLKGPSFPNLPQRSHSESPPPQPVPSAPSPEYDKIASEPSEPISSPSRKLLILDLNGTLLVRIRSLRAIYPRPYMASFRDYLFCPATRKWLDVMVWSSAQPHNVDRMVRRCFFDPRLGPMPGELGGEDGEGKPEVGEAEEDEWRGKLLAVWARDTLGLSRSDYSRKAQTTKDLDKPWSLISGNHSARTTVLLDDSPRKARLQPFNHLCVKEYSVGDRDGDRAWKKRQRRQGKETQNHATADQLDNAKPEEEPTPEEGHELAEEGLTEREKARKQKKEERKKKRAEDLAALEEKEDALLKEKKELDSALLAIIGILDALQHESNVAGWIRAGGLWAGKAPPHLDDTLKEYVLPENGVRPPSPTDLEVNGDQGGEEEEQRPVSPSLTKRQRSLGLEGIESIGGDSKRTKFHANGGIPEPEEPIAAGNDAETVGSTVDLHRPPSPSSEIATKPDKNHSRHEGSQQPKLWFEDEETFRTWIERGRKALRQLGLEERDGIHSD